MLSGHPGPPLPGTRYGEGRGGGKKRNAKSGRGEERNSCRVTAGIS